MHVELKNAPEIAALLKHAHGEYNRARATLVPFNGPMELDSNWFEGSKTWWTLVDLTDGRVQDLPQSGGLAQPRPPTLDVLPPNFALIETAVFRGSPVEARVHMNAENLTKLLPAPVELTDNERFVLKCVRSYTSAYRKEEFSRRFSDQTLAEIKAGLVVKGLLDKRGAITVSGRNAIGEER